VFSFKPILDCSTNWLNEAHAIDCKPETSKLDLERRKVLTQCVNDLNEALKKVVSYDDSLIEDLSGAGEL
jgi:hypothetical protein